MTTFKIRKNQELNLVGTILIIGLLVSAVFGQHAETRKLSSGQDIESEMAGAQMHRYKFDLKKGEFFQVRVQQKGIDVKLKLLDADGNVLATMNSPNGKEGTETLSFAAEKAGNFFLEVSTFDAKAEKGIYVLRGVISNKVTAKDKRRVEVERIFVEAINAISDNSKREKTLAKLQAAAAGWRELMDTYLFELTEKQKKQVEKQIKTEALIAEFQLPGKLVMEGQQLIFKGDAESLLAARKKLIIAFESTRKFSKKLDDKNLTDVLTKETRSDWKLYIKHVEVYALRALGDTYNFAKDWRASINYNLQARTVVREIQQNAEIRASKYFISFPWKEIEADILSSIASAFKNLNDSQETITYSKEAIALWREAQQESEKFSSTAKDKEALSLFGIAQEYRKQREHQEALKYFEQALAAFRNLPNQKSFEAFTLAEIASTYDLDLNYAKGLELKKEALKIYEEINDKANQASVLQQIGLVYFILNDEPKMREYLNRALVILLSDDYLKSLENQKLMLPLSSPVKPEASNLSAFYKADYQWRRYTGTGWIYGLLGETEKQLEYYEKSLAAARGANIQNMVRLSLVSISNAHSEKRDWRKALDYRNQALEISRRLTDKELTASDLSQLAYLYLEMKDLKKALQNAAEALLIYHALGADKNNIFSSYAGILNTMAHIQNELGNRMTAIFYGKRTVNAIQRERRQLQNLSLESQRGYLKKNERPYRQLAEWLIAEGRFTQAEQVLSMLKEEEYFDFVRRDMDEIKSLNKRVALNEAEQKLIERYLLLADRVTEIGLEFQKLDDKQRRLPEGTSLPDEEKQRYIELSRQLEDANAAFKLFLEKELVAELGREKAKEIGVDRSLQEKLRKWGAGTVALYTVVGEDRYRVILTTPTAQIDGKTEIKAEDLNKKVFEFRAALQNPSIDPRPLGKQLYDLLLKPVEKHLQAAGAKTLVWSLDGTLRYIPLAALSPDGKSYLVENYQNVIITPKTRDDLTDSDAEWQVLGVGVSEPSSVPDPDKPTEKISFSGLPGTKRELLSIVREAQAPEEQGVLTGRRFMDKDFTAAIFNDSLTRETEDGKRRYTVVHIASHFRLGSNWSNSFLLLGNGQTLTLEKVDNSPEITFGGVELITLSACNTAFADESNGREIDSLAEVIQKKYGKAVLATLWAVADESTSLLMSEFYRLRKENPKLAKSEAMRLAQKAMIEGRLKPNENNPSCRTEKIDLGRSKQTKFKCEPNAPFAHPYFWSPFILIGNWK